MRRVAYVELDSAVAAISPHDLCWQILLTDCRVFRVDIPKRLGTSPYEIFEGMQTALDNGYPVEDSFCIPAIREA